MARKKLFEGCAVATFDKLKEAADGNAQAFVWPDEGRFTRHGNWTFNDDHKDFEPLLVDRTSASMMVTLHDALSAENQEKFRTWVGLGRGQFAALWEFTIKHVKITGFKSA